MMLTSKQLVGNWVTEGTQFGWTYPASGAWAGNLVLKANMTATIHFTKGNIAKTRNGNWSLNGQTLSIIDTEKTVWTATISNPNNPVNMSGQYDSGPQGAQDGSWQARKL